MEIFSNLQLAILITTLVINTLLAFFVYKNNPKSATNIIFSVLSLVTTTWLFVMYLSLQPASLSTALFLIRLSIFLAVPISMLFYLLAHTMPNITIRLSRRFLLTTAVWSIFIMGLTVSPYVFTGIEIVNNSPRPIPGFGLPLFAITTVFFSFGAIYSLIKRLRRSTGVEKQQLRFVMFGILLMLGLIIGTIMIPVALLRNNTFVPFAPLYTLTFLGMTTYAIIKHRLMDLRLIVARTVAYTLIIGIVGLFYTLSTILVSNFFFRDLSTNEQIILFTTLTIIVAFTFQPLRRHIQKITDRFFYKGRYDSSELISSLTKIMATTLRLEDLTKGLLTNLVPEIRVSKGAFVLLKNGKVDHSDTFGYTKIPKFTSPDIGSLLETDKILVRDEIGQSKLKKIMEELDVAASVPLRVGKNEFGVLLLGHKLSGEIYTNQDIKILEILSPEISIAIQNAKAYEELSKFNVKLQEEVEKATVELRGANERLRDLDKAKDEFVSVVSHELRTPMTAIKSYVWLALNGKAGKLNPKMQNYLTKVYDSSERLISLINDVLDVSHIETGRIAVDIQPVSPLKIADEVMTTLEPRAQEQEIKLKLEKDIHVPMILADPMKLNEIYVNLIGNALKFTPKGGTISVSFHKQGESLEISVSDTGIGMSESDLNKLFTKFGRIAKNYSTIAQSTGSGLGLYITKNYIDLLHGKIWVNSELGKGTVFTFSLPTTQAKQKKPVTVTTNENKSRHFDSKKS